MFREITYAEAIREALFQQMEHDPNVIVYGIGVPDHNGVFGTTLGLRKKFGGARVFDTPLAEGGMTGFGIGAALGGLKPVHIHLRADFLLLAMDQLVNMASTHNYLTGKGVPFTVRAIIGRGWGQGCHHSKSLLGMFASVPGLRVYAPVTPREVKSCLVTAMESEIPTVIFEHRWLYTGVGPVDEKRNEDYVQGARVMRAGDDITIVATSWMVIEAMHAAEILAERGVSVEVISLLRLNPLDLSLVFNSIRFTGRCIVADMDWLSCGVGAEVAAQVGMHCFTELKMPVLRLGMANTPVPTERGLENSVYANAEDVIRFVEISLGLEPMDLTGREFYSHEKKFRGPF